jgi:hypothetical protein
MKTYGHRRNPAVFLRPINQPAPITHSIFHDVLGKNGDYTRGMFYGGRRKYLGHDSPHESVLKPPSEFMTIKQKRNSVKLRRDRPKCTMLQKLEFKKPVSETEEQMHLIRQSSLANIMKRQQYVTIQRFASLNPSEWTEVKQAGCVYYVHTSGEISDVKPWSTMSRPQSDDDALSVADEMYDDASEILDDESCGTGSLAYSGEEMKELLEFLGDQK